MKITLHLFEAHLKCPTKCWLRAASEPPCGNAYAEWVQSQNRSYRAAQTERLLAEMPPGESARSPSVEDLKASKWRLAVDIVAQASAPASSGSVPLPGPTPGGTPGQPADGTSALGSGVVGTDSTPSQESQGRGWNASLPAILESHLHAIERVPAEGRGKAAQFIPIRFIFRNKLAKDDKLLLAFDALVLSAVLGREIATGKIIHGDNHTAHKVKLGARTAESARTRATSKGLVAEVQKRIKIIAAMLSTPGAQTAMSASRDRRMRQLADSAVRAPSRRRPTSS